MFICDVLVIIIFYPYLATIFMMTTLTSSSLNSISLSVSTSLSLLTRLDINMFLHVASFLPIPSAIAALPRVCHHLTSHYRHFTTTQWCYLCSSFSLWITSPPTTTLDWFNLDAIVHSIAGRLTCGKQSAIVCDGYTPPPAQLNHRGIQIWCHPAGVDDVHLDTKTQTSNTNTNQYDIDMTRPNPYTSQYYPDATSSFFPSR
jgi:hypothetical protein